LGIIMAILSLCVENILFMFSGKQWKEKSDMSLRFMLL
jgi:hypothetical protein